MAQGRLDPDAAAVHLDNLLGDGQAKPRPALSPSARTIHLVKFLEDALLLVEWNARACVAHRNEKLTIGATRRDAHFTAVCELDGIADQIQKNLGKALLVAEAVWQVCRHFGCERQALCACERFSCYPHRLDQGWERVIGQIQSELSGLDFGDVEYRVDQPQQMFSVHLHTLN